MSKNTETEDEKLNRQAFELLITKHAKVEKLLNRKEIIEFLGEDEIIKYREAQRKIQDTEVLAYSRFIKHA